MNQPTFAALAGRQQRDRTEQVAQTHSFIVPCPAGSHPIDQLAHRHTMAQLQRIR